MAVNALAQRECGASAMALHYAPCHLSRWLSARPVGRKHPFDTESPPIPQYIRMTFPSPPRDCSRFLVGIRETVKARHGFRHNHRESKVPADLGLRILLARPLCALVR